MNSTTFVLRSAGERTKGLAMELLQRAGSPVEVIEVTPFSAAIKRTLEVGIENHSDWVMCIDADVLIRKEGVEELLSLAEKADEKIFEIQGLVLDKFFPIKRPAGNHLFRVKYAREAMELIPEEGTSLRPESDMMKAMVNKGYAIQQSSVLVGLHDYEQYFKDIYRKCFLQAKKHHWILHEVEKYWMDLAANDRDFEVALWALRSGKIYGGEVLVDKQFLKEEIKDVFSIKGLNEKASLSVSDFNSEFYIHEISRYEQDDFSQYLQPLMFKKENWDKITTEKMAVAKPGFYNKALFKLGKLLEQTGIFIKQLSGLSRS